MTDSPHRSPAGRGDQSPPLRPGTAADPAYAGQAPYGLPYQPSTAPAPTRELPAYAAYGNYDTGVYDTGEGSGHPGTPPQSHGPGAAGPTVGASRRWLWVLAAASVLVVIALVVALVIVSSADQTVVAPAPTLEPSVTTTSSPRASTPRRSTPTVPALPLPLPGQTTPNAPGQPTAPGQTETVGYGVDGTGRAMSITYVDSGGVLQTQFNVPLPWSRQVELAQPAKSSASVTIINFGREITCSVTVSGRVVERRSGSGLTICGAMG